MNIKKQIRCLYLYEAIICFRMIDVVWVLFLLGRGYSLAEVGIAEGVFHVTSIIFEIPSGMAADLFGRKRTLILSGLVGTCSCIFMMLDGWRGWIYPGMILSALSINLASGTEEALTYDSLLDAGREKDYAGIYSRMGVIGRISSALSCTVSPIAIAAGYRYTYLATAFLNLGAVLAVLGLREPRVTKEQRERKENSCKDNWIRLTRHVQATLAFIREHPQTMGKLFANAALACPCFLIMMYLQEHLVNCGWPKSWIGIPMVVIPLAGAAGAWMAGKNRMGLLKAVFVCAFLSGMGTCLTGSSILACSVFGACVARGCEGFIGIVISENVNRQFTSSQRATLISVDSMLYSVLMVAASPLTGFIGNHYSVSAIFYVLGGTLILSAVVFGLLYRKRNRRVTVYRQ
ncbi:MAG: MFS transporter [Eubacteriales bacterium]|nr:MFS transporter [Eubacteriales bacterium]